MKVVIAGGTGFLGGPLAQSLVADAHEVVVLTRRATGRPVAGGREVAWTADERGPAGWTTEIDGADAVVNLAGESIAARRWSKAQKARILESRVRATRAIANAILAARRAPAVLVNASAVGYYGALGDEIVTEDQPPGTDFLASVCKQWESEAARAASGRTRVVRIRTGLPLEKDGGALPPMLIPFRLGVGGRLGSGRQYWPWIHRLDWLRLVRWAIATNAAEGPLNVTSPTPVTNAAFTKALARALRRPAFMPAPPVALRLVLGEMADALLLSGQRAVPAKAEQLGFRFQYTNLDEALKSILAASQAAEKRAL